MWNLISNAGDAALTLPLAALCAAWLACADKRLAWRWLISLAAGLALVGLTKILHAGCGIQVLALDFRVISGHTTLATAIWATLLGLCSQAWLHRPAPGVALGLLAGALIGTARVFDHAHLVPEVVIGWLLGALIAVSFARALARAAPVLPVRLAAVGAAILLAAVLYGNHAPFEAMIRQYSPALCMQA